MGNVIKISQQEIEMDLYKELLIGLLRNQEVKVTFPDLEGNISDAVEMACYKALQKIKAIIEDDRLDDRACFMRIEEIVCALESLGSGGGGLHDFG
jgi:hypothetical protein